MIISIIALLVLVSVIFVFATDNNEVNTPPNSPEKISTVPDQSDEPDKTIDDGLYIEYSDTAFADKKDTSRVLFFHASWCSVCNFYESEIEQNGVPANVTIFKVNYDNADDLKEKYGVTVQSTFIQVDSDGAELQSWPYANGLNNINDLYDAL